MKFIQCEQGTEAWHAARAGCITASTFSACVSRVGGLTDQQTKYFDAIMAGNPQAEAMAIAGYKAKPTSSTLERALAGLPIGEPSTESMRAATTAAIERISGKPYGDTNRQFFATERGHEGEAFARMRYEQRFEKIVDESGLTLTDDGIFGASVDGMIDDDGLIEIKVPLDPLKVINIISTGDISEYLHQMQGQMWITGRKWVDFLMGVPDLTALNNGNDLYVQRVWRDDAFIEKLEAGLWEHAARVSRIETMLRTPYGPSANDAVAEMAVAA